MIARTISSGRELVRYDAMCRAIDKAYSVDEVKDIRDKAMAFEQYARQAKNPEPERQACEIRLRAERKAGALLTKMDRAKRGKPNKMSPQTTLSDLRISRDQSSRWQKLSKVPEKDFQDALAGRDKPSTKGIIRSAKPPRVDPMDPKALWIWGRLRDLERDGCLGTDPRSLMDEMTEAMRADVRRLAPLAIEWMKGFTNDEAPRH